MKLPDQVRCSVSVSAFLCFVTKAVKDYNWYSEAQKRIEGEINDLNHKLELDGLLYKERAKIATRLSDAFQRRRTAKDAVQLLTPIVEWANSAEGAKALNQLRETLGRCRKIEDNMSKRTYRFRVLREPDIQHKEGKNER